MIINTKTIDFDFFGKIIKIIIFDYYYAKEHNIKDINYDVISKCLESKNNCWEPYQSEITKEILKNGNNIFIDVGTHLGYYSLIASSLGNNVIGFDCNDIYMNLFRNTIELNNFKNIKIIKNKVDSNFSLDRYIDVNTKIKLIKCDVEGYEIEFVKSIQTRLENKMIENLILEISPKKRNNYNKIIKSIFNFGYHVYDIGLSPQRKLNEDTNLTSLKDKYLDLNNINIDNYLLLFPEEQSNFLFSLEKY